MTDKFEQKIADFGSILSFELRSSLNVSLNGISFLIEEQQSEGKVSLSTLYILKAATENLLILSNLLTLLKSKEQLHYEDIEIRDLVASVSTGLDFMIKDKKLDFTIKSKALKIQYEKQIIHTLLMSLLSSRIKACTNNSIVNCDIEVVGDTLVARIQDNGRMISDLNFVTTPNLSYTIKNTYNIGELEILLAASLVRRIDASITILQSESKVVTTIEVPLSKQPKVVRRSQHKFLIVDDDPDLVDYLKKILEALRPGANIRTAGSATDAIKVIESFTPDYIFTDLIMPNGDGFELIRHIAGKGINIVAISGLGDQKVRERVETILGIAFLEKPFTFECIRKVIERPE